MKYSIIVLCVLILQSCQKDYTCVCTSVKTKQDTIVDHIKTTRLGSKGYQKTCSKKENTYVSGCLVK